MSEFSSSTVECWSEVERSGGVEWLAGTDLDEDLAYTVRYYLGGPIQESEYGARI